MRKHKQPTNVHKLEGATLEERVENFKQIDKEVKERGYIPAFIHTDYVGKNKSQTKVIEAQNKMCACNADASNVGMYISTNRFRTPVKVSSCGAEGRGYIKVGNDNLLYVQIQKAAEALYTTSGVLRLIKELLCGAGTELRYRYVNMVNGKPVADSCPFEDAGALLKERIRMLRKEIQDNKDTNSKNQEGVNTVDPTNMVNYNQKTVEPQSYRTARPEPKPDPYANKTYDEVGTPETLLKETEEDLRTWERSMEQWKQLKDECPDLDVLLQQWASDQSFFGLAYLKLELEKGMPHKWGVVEKKEGGIKHLTERPKIVRVSYLPTVCSRMEEMSDQLKIENIYYAEKWRYEGTIKDFLRDIVAYPSIMPEQRMSMLRDIVFNNQSTQPSERPHVVMPMYVPSFDSPYYPIQPWWSIFSSMLYNLGNTIVSDAVTERENNTMFSYLIYINMSWFEKYCADNQINDDEAKEKAKKEYLKKISDFLKNKNNNGRIAALESLTSADEKNILKSVEIVEVPRTASKASLEDMELVGNAIFFAFGIHGSIVGSFGKNATSSSGTQQRELTLLKQCQLMPQQRLYLNAWDFILRWNDFDPHAYMSMKQYDLSTLDRSKTGLVERDI